MSSTDPLYLAFLITGLTVGFGHCIGMCGPIVVSLSLNSKGSDLSLHHLLYNTGRVVTYGILGGLAGTLGSFTILASSILSLQKGALILAGILILLMGLAMGGWIPFGRLFEGGESSSRVFSKWFRRFSVGNSSIVYLPLGLLLGFLPCGPVYTALIASARAGMNAQTPFAAFFAGAGLMFAFGLGTFPSLFIVGKLTSLGWVRSKNFIYRFGSMLMALLGIYFILQGIRY